VGTHCSPLKCDVDRSSLGFAVLMRGGNLPDVVALTTYVKEGILVGTLWTGPSQSRLQMKAKDMRKQLAMSLAHACKMSKVILEFGVCSWICYLQDIYKHIIASCSLVRTISAYLSASSSQNETNLHFLPVADVVRWVHLLQLAPADLILTLFHTKAI